LQAPFQYTSEHAGNAQQSLWVQFCTKILIFLIFFLLMTMTMDSIYAICCKIAQGL